MESWLVDLLGDEPDVTVVAVGSLGRKELCPYSDLDLMLLHRGRRDIGAVADRLWYPIWDSGLSLDHSVRTVKQAISVADDDFKAAIGLLDARPVAGDLALGHTLKGDVDAADEAFREAVNLLRQRGDWREAVQSCRAWADALRAADRSAEAFEVLETAAELAEHASTAPRVAR